MNFLIVAGANGSGKTTFAKEFIKEFSHFIYLNADEIKFNEQVTEINAGKIFLKRLKNSIKEKKDILIETTLSGKYIFNVVNEAKKNGYEIKLIYIFLRNVFENVKRVEIRAKSKEGHFVKEEDIIRRYKRSLENFCVMRKICEYEVYLNDISYELVADSNFIHDKEVFSEIVKYCNS